MLARGALMIGFGGKGHSESKRELTAQASVASRRCPAVRWLAIFRDYPRIKPIARCNAAEEAAQAASLSSALRILLKGSGRAGPS